MPYRQEPGKARPPGAMPTPPVTEVRPNPVVAEAPEPTHRWVMVRHAKGHPIMSAEGPSTHIGPGRHFLRNDQARDIESAESRVAAEEYSFKDPTPTARLILGAGGRSVRMAPDELDHYIGHA